MKICITALEWPSRVKSTGGVGRFNFRLAEAMASKHEVHVVTSTESPTEIAGCKLHMLQPPRSRIGRYYLMPLRLRHLVTKLRPEVVISSGDEWAISGVKIIRIMHGTAKREADTSKGLRRLNHRMLFALEKLSARRATKLFGVGPDSLQLRSDAQWYPPTVGITPTPEKDFDRSGLLFIGTFGGRKRGSIAQEVWNELKRQGKPMSLTVVGPEWDKIKWSTDVVHLSGLSDSEVRDLMSKSAFLLSPSLYEGFGIPVFEALLYGCIPLCAENEGSSLILGERLLSLLFDPATYVAGVVSRIQTVGANTAELRSVMRLRADDIARLGDPDLLLIDSR